MLPRVVVLALVLVSYTEGLSCHDLSDANHFLYDYIRLSESEYRARIEEWSTFCNNQTVKMLPLTDMQEEWAKFTSFLPLDKCIATSIQESLDTSRPVLTVLLTQVVWVFVAILIYFVKKYGPVRNSSYYINRGTQLQRYAIGTFVEFKALTVVTVISFLRRQDDPSPEATGT